MMKSGVLVQCDFDGTVTVEDASFAILDACIPGQWRDLFERYQHQEVTLGEFNANVFAMVKADRKQLLEIVDAHVRTRDGFSEFIDFCRKVNYRTVFVSNGLDFYIDYILHKCGISNAEIHASVTEFTPDGLSVQHRGPDGKVLDDEVKSAYTDYFRQSGYRVVYIGDGHSDIESARKSDYVFATGSLIDYCRKEDLPYTPFDDFFQVIQVMESWE